MTYRSSDHLRTAAGRWLVLSCVALALVPGAGLAQRPETVPVAAKPDFLDQDLNFEDMKEKRRMMTLQDVERAAIPFPDTITLDLPPKGFDAIREKRIRRGPDLDRIKAEVEKIGGKVHGEAEQVVFERTAVTDDDLGHIAVLLRDAPKLSRLWLDHTRITDAGLAHLRDLTQLTWLYLDGTDITDDGLVSLKGMPRMVGLSLENTAVGDEGMKVLSGMPALAWVTLGNTRVGDEGLRQLRDLALMEHLTLENTSITDDGLAHLANLKRLSDLYLDNTAVTDAGLVHLKSLTKLQRLYLCDTHVTDAGLVNLEGLKELYYLTLHNSFDPRLKILRANLGITDAGLEHLRGLPKLLSVTVWNTPVTEQGATRLQQANQKVQVQHGGMRLLPFINPRQRRP